MNKRLSIPILCYIYLFLTIFIGHNVISYLHLNIEGDSILSLCHYLTIPFLLLAFLINLENVVLSKYERHLIIATCLIGAFQKFVMDKSAGMSFFINSVFEPIMLCALLRRFNLSQLKTLRTFLLSFICIEFIIGFYEYFSANMLFVTSVDTQKMVMTEEIRAYALHGHPLQNSFLVSMIMCGVLSSNIKINYRYIFFFVGYLALFCFNSRSSIYFMGIILLLNLWRDFILKKQSLVKKICLFSFVGIAIFSFLSFVQNYNMGTRLAIGMDSNDGSSYARFILVKILLDDMNFTDILVGIPPATSTAYMIRYSLVAIENSFMNLIMGFGIIYVICFFYYFYKIFESIQPSKFALFSLVLIMVLLLNTNNAIQTDCPIMPISIMVLFAFKENFERNNKYKVIR